MSLPYYKRFPRDFLEGTIGLSFDEKGAYAIVLDLIYMRSGSLPDDPRYIAGQLGCSVRKWSAILSALVSKGKLVVSGGVISNLRADYLLEETSKFQDKQSEIAQKPRKNSALRQPKPSQPEPEPYTEETKASSVVALPRSRPSKRCPADWLPSESDLLTGAGEGFTSGEIERELSKFRDYQFATARSDWSATFRNWLRKAAERNPRNPSHERPDTPSAKRTAREDNLERGFRVGLAASGP